MPVVLGTPLRSGSTLLWAHAGLHAGGVILLVAGLAGGHYLTAGWGGLALGAGVCWLIGVTLRTFLRSSRRDPAAWSFPLSASWLGATVLAGVTLAVNRRAPFLSLDTVALLRAHAHLGLAGYFLTLLQGVTFQLVPMFTLGESRHPRCAAWGLAGTQFALFLLVPGLAWGWVSAIGGGALVLLLSLGSTAIGPLSRPWAPGDGVRSIPGSGPLSPACSSSPSPPSGAVHSPSVWSDPRTDLPSRPPTECSSCSVV
jgi:hypothetical protein